MRSFAANLTALVLLAGDGLQVLAGKCSPPDRCLASLSNDPAGASPYCSSLLGYQSGVVLISSTLPTAVVSVTSTLEQTVTVTQTPTTRTIVRDGTTEILTSTVWQTVPGQVTATANTEEVASSLVVKTSPILQTSVSLVTVQDTVYEYRSTTTTVVVATVTQVITATVEDYEFTRTQAVSTSTRTQTVFIFKKRDDNDRRRMPETSRMSEVAVPTYLSTCEPDAVSSACERLYPPEYPETVTEYVTPSAAVSNFVITKTVYASGAQQTQDVTVDGPHATIVIYVPGTTTIYSTTTVTVTSTRVVPYTSVLSPTEVVVVKSTETQFSTLTTYSPTIVDGRTTSVTGYTTVTERGVTKTVWVPLTTVVFYTYVVIT